MTPADQRPPVDRGGIARSPKPAAAMRLVSPRWPVLRCRRRRDKQVLLGHKVRCEGRDVGADHLGFDHLGLEHLGFDRRRFRSRRRIRVRSRGGGQIAELISGAAAESGPDRVQAVLQIAQHVDDHAGPLRRQIRDCAHGLDVGGTIIDPVTEPGSIQLAQNQASPVAPRSRRGCSGAATLLADCGDLPRAHERRRVRRGRGAAARYQPGDGATGAGAAGALRLAPLGFEPVMAAAPPPCRHCGCGSHIGRGTTPCAAATTAA